jgi:hypothetical protein
LYILVVVPEGDSVGLSRAHRLAKEQSLFVHITGERELAV